MPPPVAGKTYSGEKGRDSSLSHPPDTAVLAGKCVDLGGVCSGPH